MIEAKDMTVAHKNYNKFSWLAVPLLMASEIKALINTNVDFEDIIGNIFARLHLVEAKVVVVAAITWFTFSASVD